jgi:hypothetical protein
VIRLGEKQDEIMQRFRRALCGVDQALPFLQWRGMNSAQGKPAVAIRKRDGEILWVLRDVGSNPLPADRAVFATKVVIICRHGEATMARVSGKARPAGKLRETPFPPALPPVIESHPMNDEDFHKLVMSVRQMGTIIQGGKLAHRCTTLTDLNVDGLRERTGPIHATFQQIKCAGND